MDFIADNDGIPPVRPVFESPSRDALDEADEAEIKGQAGKEAGGRGRRRVKSRFIFDEGTEARILDMVRLKQPAGAGDMAGSLKMSLGVLKRYLRRLVSEGKLEETGL